MDDRPAGSEDVAAAGHSTPAPDPTPALDPTPAADAAPVPDDGAEETGPAATGSTDATAPTDATAEADEVDNGRSKLAGVAADVASTIVDAAQAGLSAAQAGISAARPILQGVEDMASGARRAFDERSGARVRRVRKMAREPLANLWDVHPEARRASIRELGLLTVPGELIAGTAVEGAAQRGGDFLPLRDRRGDDWRARWQRILSAVEGLVSLPPVELIKFGDRYWVVDGHNRVAAALYTGQAAVDAVVTEFRLPGVPRERTPTSIASVLEGSQDLRQAGAGRLTKTSVRPDRLPAPSTQPAHDHGLRPPSDDAQPADETGPEE